MATATYKRGEIRTVQYTTLAAVAVGDIIVGGVVDAKECRILVAKEAAAASGEVIICAASGVWKFPKVSGAVIKAGESVNWDSSEGKVDDNAHTTGAGDVAQFGMAVIDAGNGVTVLDVDIAQPGTYDAA